MPREETIGSGITKRLRVTYDVTGKTPGDTAAARNALRAMAHSIGEKGVWVANTQYMREVCSTILTAKDRADGFEADSREWFAQQIIRVLDIADSCIAEGDASNSARFALEAGRLWAAAAIKFRWEEDALRGEKVAGGASNSAHATNQRHQPLREKRLARMSELVPQLGVNSASCQCESEGMGQAEAIKRQWNRWKNRDS